MRQLVKKTLNRFFMKTISYRIVHDQMAVDYDIEVWKSLKVHGFTPQTFIDVGAAQGVWTTQMLEIFPHANYFMIDPLNENENALKAVTERCPNVQYWKGAVGSHAEELEFYVHGDQSSMFKSVWGREESLRRVPMKTLDGLVKEIHGGAADGLKLDVQGAELEVLKGADATMRRCKVVQVEVSFRRIYDKAPLAHEIIHFFAEQGFRIYDIASLYKRKDRALLQTDLFFVKDDKLFEPETWEVT